MISDSDITRLPSNVATIQAANESAFELVPGFCLTAPALREVVDAMADAAMSGLEQINAAIASAPADMLPLLDNLRALFISIGRSGDGTANDVGVNLDETWAVAAA